MPIVIEIGWLILRQTYGTTLRFANGTTKGPFFAYYLQISGCRGGGKGGQGWPGPAWAGASNFQSHKLKCVFNKRTVKVCASCSWRFPGTSMPSATYRFSVGLKQRTCRGWGPLKGVRSAQKTLQGSETETTELLEERKRIVFPWQRLGVIYLPYRQINDFLPFCPPLIFECLCC